MMISDSPHIHKYNELRTPPDLGTDVGYLMVRVACEEPL